MCDLDTALQIAANAHRGQKDKGGSPYILHPLRLALNFQKEDLQIIALLHDVIEDSEVTLEDLAARGFSRPILDALDALTKRPNETYECFIDRIKCNPLATAVKRQDLLHNLDLTRLGTVTEQHLARINKYLAALKVLSVTQERSSPR